MSNAPATRNQTAATTAAPGTTAPFDLLGLFQSRLGEDYKLHAKYINPSWARVAQLIGYDKVYQRAEGCWLFDTEGNRYLDLVSGFCVSNVGHNHPTVRDALTQLL